MKPLTVLSISIGGVVGALIRWGLIELVGDQDFPWAVFALNVVGSALLGCVVAELLAEHSRLPKDVLVGAAAGFCGSLTTFSTFAVEIAELLRDARIGLGISYAFMSVGLGLIAAWWGHWTGAKLNKAAVQKATKKSGRKGKNR